MDAGARFFCHLLDLIARFHVDRAAWWVIGNLYWIYFKGKNNVKVIGKQHIPRNKNFILVGNHSSVADAYLLFALMAKLRLPFWYITKVTEKERNDPLRTRLLRLSGGIPRVGKGATLVRWMVNVLTDPRRRRVAIPPEGMYNEGKLMEGFTGVVRVYYEANRIFKIPILPVVSIGAEDAYPTKPDLDGKFRPRKHKGIIGVVGTPFHLARPSKEQIEQREFFREQLGVIMERMRRLMRQKEGIARNWKLDQVRSDGSNAERSYS